MSIDASPPIQPPQLSPDGKWVWDGSQWQPVVGVDSGRAAVFPSWSSIEVPAAQPAVDPVPLGVQYETPAAQYQPPAADYSYAAADEPIVPLWKQPRKGKVSIYLYPVAGLAVLLMAMMLLNSVGYIQLPWNTAGSASPTASHTTTRSPTPDSSGPDSQRADRFINAVAPVIAAMEKTAPALDQHCYKTLINSCYDAIVVTEPLVKNILAAIKNGDIPKCIGTQMAFVQSSAAQMEEQLQLALTGFKDGSSDELYTGIYRFWTYRRNMELGMISANQAKKSCYTIVLPTWVPSS